MNTVTRILMMTALVVGCLFANAGAANLGSLSVEILAPRSNNPSYGEPVTTPVNYAVKLLSTGHAGSYTIKLYDAGFTNEKIVATGAYTAEGKLISGTIATTDVAAGAKNKILYVEAIATEKPEMKAYATMQFDARM